MASARTIKPSEDPDVLAVECEHQAPQAVNDDRVAAWPAQLAEMGAGIEVAGVDVPVTEVAD